jgi:hypothetical protein
MALSGREWDALYKATDEVLRSVLQLLVTANVVFNSDSSDPDGGETVIRNVGFYRSHVRLHLRRRHSSELPL